MSLNKRASLLILPIILASYCLAAIVVYKQQQLSLLHLEQTQLDNRLARTQAAFTHCSTFVDAYLVSLLEGEILANFIREPNNIYRERKLFNNLQAAVKRYQFDKLEFASLTILSPENGLLLYAENSTDPFATVRKEQKALASKLFQEKKAQAWEHVMTTENSLIQQGISIDSRTLMPPLDSQMDHTLQVIIAIHPSEFASQVKQLETHYRTSAILTHEPKPLENSFNPTQLSGQIKLKGSYYLQLTPSPDYLGNLLKQLQFRLIIFVAIGAFVTFVLLQLLIRRYITNPISTLDKQLIEVISHQRQNIDPPNSNDEVGRLGKRFYNLYAQLHQAYKLSQKQSLTDSLTQLPNRSAFYQDSDKAIKKASEQKENISFIYIDLDNFKFVNDKYGHEIGDHLLKEVAFKLQKIINESRDNSPSNIHPYLARLSGDEFIATYSSRSQQELLSLTDKLLSIFNKGVSSKRGNFPITASIGIATYPYDGHSVSELISNADLAMYQAKRSGKNQQASYSEELAKQTRETKEIESRLKEIDCEKEFTLYYMPIFNLEGEVYSCEALLRWHSPALGPVSPALFIPIAESTGFFEKIDLWVIEKTFKDLPVLQQLLGQKINVSFNISSAEINSEHFIHQLSHIVKKHNINPKKFTIEITETFAINQEYDVISWLSHIRKTGFHIAIDDFGTGYTSLMQMVDYPADIIKFDKQLIDRITQTDRQSLIKALIDLCHLQNIRVVAEGIETPEQYELLKTAQCDYLQGFLFAKPMSLQDLAEWKESSGINHLATLSER